MRLTFEEGRVIAVLAEKAMTTPDNYPMSLNGVVVACNQVSNRHPVVEFSEVQVELMLRSLADKGTLRMVRRSADRVVKYRHTLDEALGLADEGIALLAVLLLRGDQTPGELRSRTSRYVNFESLEEVEAALAGLGGRETPLVVRLERQPGTKESRYREALTEENSMGDLPSDDVAVAASSERTDPSVREDLERLAQRFEALLDQLGVEDI